MDYKSAEHTLNWHCPDCDNDNYEYEKKEDGLDDYGNEIKIIKCKCGKEYWFHCAPKKGITFETVKQAWKTARDVIGSKKVDSKTKHMRIQWLFQAYFSAELTEQQKIASVCFIDEINQRIKYDLELFKDLLANPF